jgi:hypothetical protein
MEPGEWARKVLDIIESETRDLVHSGNANARVRN